MSFQALYRVILSNDKRGFNFNMLDNAMRYASLNKVLLYFLRVMEIENDVRRVEENRLKNIVKTVEIISKSFSDLNYVFYKLVKPVTYVPADIDILISDKDIWRAVSRLRYLGFKIEIVEPYTITMVKRNTIVDLYLHPSIGGIIYLDGGKLLEYSCIRRYHSIEIPCLEDYVEAIVVAAHAVYKERIYTLNDYITIKRYLSKKSFRLAEELKSKLCLDLSVYINSLVDSKYIVLPYHIPIPLWIKALLSKFLDDKITRVSTLNIINTLKDRRVGKQIISKLTRETY